MKFQTKNIFLASTLLVFSVTSCMSPSTNKQSLIPTQALPQSEVTGSQVQPDTAKAEAASTSQVVHRESQIEKTELKASEPSEEAELNQLLAEIEKEDNFSTSLFFQSRVFITRFRTQKTGSKHDVQIPKNGEFKVILREGSEFKYLDDDATDDNTIIIQMPKNNFKTYILLQSKKNSSLQVADDLYHVQDTLEGRLFDRWLSLGTRPIPVPSDWESPNGNDFVLRFNAKDVKGFYMGWFRTNDEVSSPPGIASIGPEGGLIELPGIGKVEFPAGALDNQTTIRMEELLNAPVDNLFVQDVEYEGGTAQSLREYISPVVRIYPEGLALKKRAAVTLKIDQERLGKNHPSMVDRFAQSGDTFLSVFDGENAENGVLSQDRDMHTPFYVEQLADYYLTIPAYIRPEDEFISESSIVNTLDSNFSISQVPAQTKRTVCNTARPYRWIYNTALLIKQPQLKAHIQATVKNIQTINSFYCSKMTYHPPLNATGYIPVGIGYALSKIDEYDTSKITYKPATGAITNFFTHKKTKENIRAIGFTDHRVATANSYYDQVPHELFHLFSGAGMSEAKVYDKIPYWYTEGIAQAVGSWLSIQKLGFSASSTTVTNLDGNQDVLNIGMTKRLKTKVIAADGTPRFETGYGNGSFFLSASHKNKKYGRDILFEWTNYLNSLGENNQLSSLLDSRELEDLLNSKLIQKDLQGNPLDLSKLFYMFTLDSLYRHNLFDTNPEPHKVKQVLVTNKQTLKFTNFDTSPVKINGSLSDGLLARYYEIEVDPSLIAGAQKAEISVYLDSTNLPQKDILGKLAQYITVAAVKGTSNNYTVVKTFKLIDQLTINGQQKRIKIINAHKINYDRLIVIVPNTTFGTNVQNIDFEIKAYRSPQLASVVNTETPGWIKFTGQGFSKDVVIHFAAFDRPYTTAFAEVQGEGDNQSFEVRIPDDAKDGALFVASRGISSNELSYQIDHCKKELFTTASISEQVKCLK